MPIQMKASEQCFPLVLCLVPYEVVLSFECEREILKCVQSKKPTKKYFLALRFPWMSKVFLRVTLPSV